MLSGICILMRLPLSAQAEYQRAFRTYKPDKKLRWLPQLGSVDLTIDLKDRSLSLQVTPLQASVLELFNQQGAISPYSRTRTHS